MKTKIIGSILGVAVVISVAFAVYQFNEINTLSVQAVSFQTDIAALQGEIDNLNNEISIKKEELKAKEEEMSTLGAKASTEQPKTGGVDTTLTAEEARSTESSSSWMASRKERERRLKRDYEKGYITKEQYEDELAHLDDPYEPPQYDGNNGSGQSQLPPGIGDGHVLDPNDTIDSSINPGNIEDYATPEQLEILRRSKTR